MVTTTLCVPAQVADHFHSLPSVGLRMPLDRSKAFRASRQKTLPQELIQQIVLAVDPSLLTTLARTCHSLQVEAERLLYQCILIDELFVLRSVHDALIASPRIRGTAVRSLIIPMRKRPFPSENIDYAQHIRGILSLTPKLTCFKTYHYPTYRTRILRPTPGLKLGFKLKTLVVRFSFDPSLLDFLTSQTEIEDLEIIGWKGDDASSSLPSTALPKLRTLTGTHESVRKLAPGRPITTVSVDRFWHDHDDFKNALSGLLDALGHSTASGVANLRLHLPEIHTGRDVKKIGDMLPSLRRLTLHADWIPLDAFICSAANEDWSTGLSTLKHLTYLKLTTLEIVPAHELQSTAMGILAKWKSICTSLNHVIFPDDSEYVYDGGTRGWEEVALGHIHDEVTVDTSL